MLTRELVKEAVELVTPSVLFMIDEGVVHRTDLAIVVAARNKVVPQHEHKGVDSPSIVQRMYDLLYMGSLRGGDLMDGHDNQELHNLMESWDYPFLDIAQGKVRLSARTGLDTRVVHTQKRHLLLPGDVKYWGSVVDEELVVGASAFKPWMDELVCKMIVAMIRALEEQYAEDFDVEHGSDHPRAVFRDDEIDKPWVQMERDRYITNSP